MTRLRKIGSGTYSKVYQKNSTTARKKGVFSLTEVDLTRKVNHPCIINSKSFRFERIDGVEFHGVMDMPLGSSFYDFIKGTNISDTWNQRLWHLFNVACGLDFMNSNGYLHCDIKLDNIILIDGVAKLIDFSITLPMVNGKGTDTFGLYTITHRPPEILESKFKDYETITYTPKCEAWAFGILLLEVLCPKCKLIRSIKKYTDDDDDDLLYDYLHYALKNKKKAMNQIYKSLEKSIPLTIKKSFVDLVKKCLSLNPETRWDISQVVNHSLFAPRIPIPGKVKEHTTKNPSGEQLEILKTVSHKVKSNYQIYLQAYSIFTRSNQATLDSWYISIYLACNVCGCALDVSYDFNSIEIVTLLNSLDGIIIDEEYRSLNDQDSETVWKSLPFFPKSESKEDTTES